MYNKIFYYIINIIINLKGDNYLWQEKMIFSRYKSHSYKRFLLPIQIFDFTFACICATLFVVKEVRTRTVRTEIIVVKIPFDVFHI